MKQMTTLTETRNCDISGYRLPGPTSDLLTEMEACSIVLEEQIARLRELHREEIARDSVQHPLLARNADLRERHTGETCYILGSGPSLNDVDFEALGDQVYFGLNTVFRADNCPELRYHAMTDRVLYELSGEYGEKQRSELFEELKANVATDGEFFTIYQYLDTVESQGLLSLDRCRFVRMYPFSLSRGIFTMPDLTLGIPCSHNVAQFALMCAIGMGFERIVLLGLDHNYFAEDFGHAYQRKKLKRDTENRFARSLGDQHWASWHIWRAYQHLQNLALNHNVVIENGSPQSRLDVFPFVETD